MWRLRCDCGNEIEHSVDNLGTDANSCGCLRREQTAQRTYRHGDARHDSRSPLYRCWSGIKSRCFNPKNPYFKHYGGRGITVAAEWVDDYPAFRKFVAEELGPRPKGCSIDRIENHDGYFPGNIQWATPSQQINNSRHSIISKAVDAMVRELSG
jgi:hypothetical protein